ncbi:MAG: FecR family protein [Acidobacteriota bacterium]
MTANRRLTSVHTLAKWGLLTAITSVVCLGQFSDAGVHAAKAETATGRVSVERDRQLLAIMPGDILKVQETVVTGVDGHALFRISDGSTIEVFPNSRFTFRKNAPTWSDLLDVWLGRVRVQIQHLGNQPNPNRVLTPAAAISVRGTIFDITVSGDDESTVVEVEEGLVDVQHALLGGKKSVAAGESITVYRDAPLAHGKDKGTIFRQAIHMAMDAAVAATQRGGTGLPGGSTSPGGVGNTGPGTGPPTTPPTTTTPLPPVPGTSTTTTPSTTTTTTTVPSLPPLPSLPALPTLP